MDYLKDAYENDYYLKQIKIIDNNNLNAIEKYKKLYNNTDYFEKTNQFNITKFDEEEKKNKNKLQDIFKELDKYETNITKY